MKRAALGALLLASPLVSSPAFAQDAADTSLGQRLAQSSCAQCHGFEKGQGHGVGPNLHGLIGRPAASASGFEFSKPYTAAMQGKTWDRALLEQWLTDTQALAPGSGMVYFQDDPRKRAELIKYLESLH